LTPIGKPQGFGFAEFEQAESMLRAIELLNGLDLPSQESGQPNKNLLVSRNESFDPITDVCYRYVPMKRRETISKRMNHLVSKQT
jgi:hypothetical protein